MPTIAQIAARILLVTQAAWMVAPAPAQAQPTHHGRHTLHRAQHHQHRPMHTMRQPMHERVGSVASIPNGSFFNTQHQDTARAFYNESEHQGYCPPGLKKDCVSAGKTKVWQLGHALPDSVVRYRLPRPLELRLGPPPEGHYYARVGADLLLLTQDRAKVVDAIENAVR